MSSILDYTGEQEQECGAKYAKLERDDPELAERANNLCKLLGLYGMWRSVNSVNVHAISASTIQSVTSIEYQTSG